MNTAKQKAYQHQKDSGKLKSNRSKIESYAKEAMQFTIADIQFKLGIAWKTSTARLSELEDDGIVFKTGQVIETNKGSFSMYAYEFNLSKRKERAKSRKELKFKAWCKRGLNEFQEFIAPELVKEFQG